MICGNLCVEVVLEKNIFYMLGLQWLYDFVLCDCWVLVVVGIYGKIIIVGMVIWILEQCGYKLGFVIGGVLGNFEVLVYLGESDFFVIEVDEYDCVFFDKCFKFVYYCLCMLIFNNFEFDYVDIFDDLKVIQKQFYYLVCIVLGQGCIIWLENDINLKQIMVMGCWSEQELVGEQGYWQVKKLIIDVFEWEVLLDGEKVGEVKWLLVGEYNMYNGLMVIAAVCYVGVVLVDVVNVLGLFINVCCCLELCGEVNGVMVYDDFVYYLMVILVMLVVLCGKVGGMVCIIVVLELCLNIMKMGICKDDLVFLLGCVDEVFLL